MVRPSLCSIIDKYIYEYIVLLLFDDQGSRYVERVIQQEESYEATRDQLRAARRKKDGKTEAVATPGKPLTAM